MIVLEIKRLAVDDEELAYLKSHPTKKNNKFLKYQLYLLAHAQVTDEEIQTFQTEYAIDLPIEYQLFLKQHNGGRPTLDCFGDEVINYFYGLLDWKDSFDSIQHAMSDRYPKSMLPLASIGGDDHLLLGWRDEFKSKIYYWDHELEHEESGENYFENIKFVANGLHEFLEMLYDLDEE